MCYVTQVAENYARPLLESGQLIEVLADYKTEGYDISVVFLRQTRIAPKLRVFVNFLVALFERAPWSTQGAPARRTVSMR